MTQGTNLDNETRKQGTQKEAISESIGQLEGDISSKWMIWIGGVTLALGGVFLVKYSIDAGLLHPVVRVFLGAMLGLGLIGGGEWVRRKQSTVNWLKGRPSYIPGSVAASGLLILFASVYSACALYDLISFLLAFMLLALISVGASWLARLHGKYFAYLGLVAGMVVPILLLAKTPSAWGLFPYLIAIIGASLWGARHNRWVDVTIASLSMAGMWTIGWIVTNWHSGDVVPVGLFILSLAAVNQWMLRGASMSRTLDKTIMGLAATSVISIISDVMTIFCVLMITSMVRLEHYSLTSLVIALGGFLAMIVAASPKFQENQASAEYDTALIITLFGGLFLLATWHIPEITNLVQYIGETPANAFARLPIKAPGFEVFLTTSVCMAIVVGVSAYWWLKDVFRKNLWSIVGVAYPLLILAIDFWRLDGYENNVPFVSVSFALAGLFAYAAYKISWKKSDEWQVPLATYIAGATSAVSIALAMVLKDAWLSFALTLEVAVLGYLWRQISIDGVRTLALALSGIILVRLFLNLSIFEYGSEGALPWFNWLWYAYALGALLFFVAAKLFDNKDPSDTLISVLRAGSALLLCAFVTFELRVFLSETGTLNGSMDALETALQTLNLTIFGLVIYWRAKRDDNDVLASVSHLISFAGIVLLILGGGIYNNILVHEMSVGSLPILNLQIIQFLLPGLLYGFKALIANESHEKNVRFMSGIVALGSIFLWLTLEVRHFFYPTGGSGPISDWEWYGYSVVWLIYAALLLVLGVKANIQGVRRAGISMLGLVIVKVFLFDLNHLEGVARALSFIGLGLTLIAMGYLYQYFRHQQKLRIEQAQANADTNLYSMD